jgi:hypothetical protein
MDKSCLGKGRAGTSRARISSISSRVMARADAPIESTRSIGGRRANPLGIHALVWAGGWTEEDCRAAVESTRDAGYDFIEVPLLDPSTVDVEMTRKHLESPDLRASCLLGLSFETDISSEDTDVFGSRRTVVDGRCEGDRRDRSFLPGRSPLQRHEQVSRADVESIERTLRRGSHAGRRSSCEGGCHPGHRASESLREQHLHACATRDR